LKAFYGERVPHEFRIFRRLALPSDTKNLCRKGYDEVMVGLSEHLKHQILSTRTTFMGIGPMSKTVTRVAIELANQYRFPISLIPSRRQVDAASLGGGYVENWTTYDFSRFVRSLDKGGFVLLSRDHSGPWQSGTNSEAKELTFPEAMDEVKQSLADDIANGFNLLHIDPCIGMQKGFSENDVEDMAVELISYCHSMNTQKDIVFEIGTDEQNSSPDEVEISKIRLDRMLHKLDKYKLPKPLFYVLQTGTKVAELRNVGSFDQPLSLKGSLPSTVLLPAILELCESRGVMLKEHNADYLSASALKWHRKFGIHGANVAPEFGVCETKAIEEILIELKMNSELERFMRITLEGGKWGKWLLPDSLVSDNDKFRIAGHYHFSNPEVIEIRCKAQMVGRDKGIDIEARIENAIHNSIDRYLKAFGYGQRND